MANSNSTTMIAEEKILLPYLYICELPGKKIRSKLAMAFNQWLKIPDDRVDVIIQIIQMLHNASLMVDDIEDDSKLRRGQPVAHMIYGIPLTINAANFIYFKALDKIIHWRNYDAIKIFTEELLELHTGQGKDIYWRDSLICPTEQEYFEMVIQKTGGLFRLAFKLMQLFSQNQTDFTDLLNNLALYFQIRDDYENLLSTEYFENKSFCEDLSEGKFSFPIIYGIEKDSNNLDKLQNILKQKTQDKQLKTYCIQLLKDCGAFKHTYDTIKLLETKIRSAITEQYGGNDQLLEIMENLIVIKRH